MCLCSLYSSVQNLGGRTARWDEQSRRDSLLDENISCCEVTGLCWGTAAGRESQHLPLCVLLLCLPRCLDGVFWCTPLLQLQGFFGYVIKIVILNTALMWRIYLCNWDKNKILKNKAEKKYCLVKRNLGVIRKVYKKQNRRGKDLLFFQLHFLL